MDPLVAKSSPLNHREDQPELVMQTVVCTRYFGARSLPSPHPPKLRVCSSIACSFSAQHVPFVETETEYRCDHRLPTLTFLRPSA